MPLPAPPDWAYAQIIDQTSHACRSMQRACVEMNATAAKSREVIRESRALLARFEEATPWGAGDTNDAQRTLSEWPHLVLTASMGAP
jgi:hypothetical protein